MRTTVSLMGLVGLLSVTLIGVASGGVTNEEPQLCVGNYQTEEEAEEQLARFVGTYATQSEWRDRARTIREGILRDTGLTPMPKKCPLKPIIHSLRQYEGYTVAPNAPLPWN